MATQHVFNGKVVKLPGAYSMVKSVAPAVFTSSTYSKALIINTDATTGYGGSVNGELTSGADALYRVRTLQEAQALLKGGRLWQLTQPLFVPSRLEGVNGASELYYINALTTTAPTLTIQTEGGDGSIVIKCKDEGVANNGVKKDSAGANNPDNLLTGYAATLEAGVRDTTKFIIKVWLGTFKGLYTDNLPYDGIPMEDCRPELVLASPEISTPAEFQEWAATNEDFNDGFVLDSATGTGFTSDDVTAGALILATGGTTGTFNLQTDLVPALDALQKVDFNVVLSLSAVGVTGSDVINARLQYFVQSETKYPKYLVVPGASGSAAALQTNLTAARGFNSERVWVTHGTPRKNASYAPDNYRVYDGLYLAAAIAGRILGLPPQVPGTFKDLDIDGLSYELTDPQKEDCLDAGLLAVHYDDDFDQYTMVRAINTLQKNTSLMNPDGSTFSIQISRIITQLNTDLTINAKRELFQNNYGANLFTVSPEYLQSWTEEFLESRVARPLQDNLITRWWDVSVERRGDAYYVCYHFETNTEIAFAFFTGFAVN